MIVLLAKKGSQTFSPTNFTYENFAVDDAPDVTDGPAADAGDTQEVVDSEDMQTPLMGTRRTLPQSWLSFDPPRIPVITALQQLAEEQVAPGKRQGLACAVQEQIMALKQEVDNLRLEQCRCSSAFGSPRDANVSPLLTHRSCNAGTSALLASGRRCNTTNLLCPDSSCNSARESVQGQNLENMVERVQSRVDSLLGMAAAVMRPRERFEHQTVPEASQQGVDMRFNGGFVPQTAEDTDLTVSYAAEANNRSAVDTESAGDADILMPPVVLLKKQLLERELQLIESEKSATLHRAHVSSLEVKLKEMHAAVEQQRCTTLSLQRELDEALRGKVQHVVSSGADAAHRPMLMPLEKTTSSSDVVNLPRSLAPSASAPSSLRVVPGVWPPAPPVPYRQWLNRSASVRLPVGGTGLVVQTASRQNAEPGANPKPRQSPPPTTGRDECHLASSTQPFALLSSSRPCAGLPKPASTWSPPLFRARSSSPPPACSEPASRSPSRSPSPTASPRGVSPRSLSGSFLVKRKRRDFMMKIRDLPPQRKAEDGTLVLRSHWRLLPADSFELNFA